MYIQAAGSPMKVKVAKWGNSLAVRLPKRLADDLGLRPGAVVDVNQDGSRLAIETAAPKTKFPRYRLEDLLAEMDRLGPENTPEYIDWGPDSGAEIIDDEYTGGAPTAAGRGSRLGRPATDARRRAKRRKAGGRTQRS
jgi:antitoxin MazE